MKHGGVRKGAGRPHRFGEPTKQIRVPVSAVKAIYQFIERKGLELPLFGSKVAAGIPSPADDHIETYLNLTDYLVKNTETTFLVRVSGYSMKDAGINEDDMLVVDRNLAPSHGKIVIAALDGQLTVKRIHKINQSLFLMPANDEFSPIEIKEENNIYIWGVVTNVIRQL